MGKQVVTIGGASAGLYETPLGVSQFARMAPPPDYLVFDVLSESIVGRLAKQKLEDPDAGYAKEFIDILVGPYLRTLCDRGIKLIANAGGVNPQACARALRALAHEVGANPRIAIVDGSNIDDRLDETLAGDTTDMFTGERIAEIQRRADKLLSFTAYLGAFPVAAALAAGADIVITGRVVDSALTLGALIHEFGWGPDDFDLLAGGTLTGHLLECSTQVTGGTFTDWREVPDWENIGFPIAECAPDSSAIITKPAGTGGLVSVGTVTEQLLYEVGDVGSYLVPDVACDFSGVSVRQVGVDRVRVSGARGLSRPSTYKACLTYESGWRGIYAIPIVGREAPAKAERLGAALLGRTRTQLRERNLGPWLSERAEAVGAESAYGDQAGASSGAAREVVARVAVVHEERDAVKMFMTEASATQMLVVGSSIPLTQSIVPLQHITSMLVAKAGIEATVTLDDGDARPVPVAETGDFTPALTPRHEPPAPEDGTTLDAEVPLEALAWVRGGEKGDLFNVAVIARDPRFTPFLAAALTPEAIGDWYRHMFDDKPCPVETYFAPGLNALNFVLRGTVGGGIASNLKLDAACKGNAQQLLDFLVPVPAHIAAEVNPRVLAREPALV